MNNKKIISGGLLVYPEKTVAADLVISDGKILEITAPGGAGDGDKIDASGCYVFPGLIDPHAHPVYLDKIEDYSRTAAYGGITTVAHYAYARPGIKLMDALGKFRQEGEDTSYIDFVLHGGLFETMKQADEIPEAFKMGVTSFKVFMAYAKLGWMTDDYAMAKMMDITGRLGGMVAVHAETGLAIDYIMDTMLEEKADFQERFLEISPDTAEAEGIFRAVSIGHMMDCPVYIPHISSTKGIEVLEFLKDRGYKVYGETCPQYLGLTWDELKSRGPLGKVGPSIKTENDRFSLWDAVRCELIDTIGSDHAPKAKKVDDDFFKAAYGSPEVETMLPVMRQFGVNTGFITPNRLVEIMAENSARIMGIFPRKGRLEPGADADVVIFDPSESWRVDMDNQHSNARYCLFEGKDILGRVKKVFTRGNLLVDGDNFIGEKGRAEFIATKAGQWFPGSENHIGH
jgi:dihydropyrimidinase